MSIIIEATRENFDEAIAEPGPTLVDVWGPQCAPCLALNPHVEQLADRYPDLRIVKLEAPKARRVCIKLRVMGLPTLLLFHEGKEVSRISDPNLRAEQLDAWLQEQIEQQQGADATS